ncbi:hypothetical protein SAMN05444413_103178 [Roseivivax marinus]|uniref:cache domain-containing protein n=1 Tax=Roseivivax marinus TaxID=1379903 RepID=UPI0008B4499C|nr:cache domain-containing protein [Roseivivax marinus]SEK75629.1 hypothetical protein SAMN05444413_103178 [Roseivivax marinus]
MTRRRLPRLSLALTFWNGLFLAIVAVAVFVGSHRHVDDLGNRIQEDHALKTARAVALTFSKAIDREWESLRAVAAKIDPTDYASARSFADAVLDASSSVAWAGIAGRDGVVIAGAGGMREGDDVSGRRWFREGLRGPNAGTVYRPDDAEAEGFVNLSTPVLDAAGEPLGVVVYRISTDWVERYVADAADTLGIDAFVVDAQNSVVSRHLPNHASPLTDREIMTKRLRMERGLVVDGISGDGFVSALVPNFSGPNNPSLGWDLIVRVPERSPALIDATQPGWGVVLGLAIVGGMLGIVYLVNFLLTRCIAGLARGVDDLAHGIVSYPSDRVSSQEAEQLSHALTLLQTETLNRNRELARARRKEEEAQAAQMPPPKQRFLRSA